MDNSRKKNNLDNDEIDFGFLKSGIDKFFSKITSSILYCSFLIKKRLGLITATTFISILIFILIFILTKPIYTTTLTLSSNFLNNEYCIEVINNLEELIDEKNYIEFAKELRISEELTQNIQSIKYDNFNSLYKKVKTDTTGIPFKIEVKVYNNNILDSLQRAIINYLENNKFAVSYKLAKKASLEKLQNKLQNELSQLDTLKVVLNQSLSAPLKVTGGIIIKGGSEPVDPVNTYKQSMELYEQLLEVQEELAVLSNIEVIKEFTKYRKPSWPKAWIHSILGLLTGLIIGLFIASKLEGRKTVNT